MLSPDPIDYSLAPKLLTAELASKGADAVAEMIYNKLLTDSEGKPKIVCSDSSRGKYNTKNYKGELESDNKLTKLAERLNQAIPERKLMEDCLKVAEKKKVGDEDVGLLAYEYRDRIQLKDKRTSKSLKNKVNKNYKAQEKELKESSSSNSKISFDD